MPPNIFTKMILCAQTTCRLGGSTKLSARRLAEASVLKKESLTDMKKRQKMLVGNWKMNKTPKEAERPINSIKARLGKPACEVVLCVPFVDLHIAKETTRGTEIKIGAQNCHFEQSGAFTGEVSAKMLKALSVEYVILGHSERRAHFNESDEMINKKVKTALAEGLHVIFCVGETLHERELNITSEKISLQVKAGLAGVSAEELQNVSVAYEPVWAIGTGKTATKELANEVCAEIREILAGLYGEKTASEVRILYGGSVNAENARDLLSMEHIDGGLIGGASLNADEFSQIINCATR